MQCDVSGGLDNADAFRDLGKRQGVALSQLGDVRNLTTIGCQTGEAVSSGNTTSSKRDGTARGFVPNPCHSKHTRPRRAQRIAVPTFCAIVTARATARSLVAESTLVSLFAVIRELPYRSLSIVCGCAGPASIYLALPTGKARRSSGKSRRSFRKGSSAIGTSSALCTFFV
jgi:hypothetical protein